MVGFDPYSASFSSSPPLCWPTRITPGQRLLGGPVGSRSGGRVAHAGGGGGGGEPATSFSQLRSQSLLARPVLPGKPTRRPGMWPRSGKAPWHSCVCQHHFPGQGHADTREEMKRRPTELSTMVPPIPVLPAFTQAALPVTCTALLHTEKHSIAYRARKT